MAAVGHFGFSKFTLDHISGYFRSIQIFLIFLLFFFTKWLPVAILYVRKHFYPLNKPNKHRYICFILVQSTPFI